MQAVSPPTANAAQLYDDVSSRREAATTALLTAARRHVQSAYLAYVAEPEPASALSPLGFRGALRQALRSNYEALKRTEPDLYGTLKLAARWCPYCGDRPVTSLDHYLPDARFPEYSILPLNLVPACSDCNRIKSTKFIDAAGEPLFLHAYLDDFTDVRCLDASLDTSTGVALLKFSICCPGTVQPSQADKLERHFEHLGLASFYKDRGEQEAAVRAAEVKSLLAEGYAMTEASESLRRSANAIRRVHGQNHWRTVVVETLSRDPAFCSGACSGGAAY